MRPSQHLTQTRRGSRDEADRQRLLIAGWLLVSGAMISLAATATPNLYEIWTVEPPQRFLELVDVASRAWIGAHAAFLIGAILTTFGLAALTGAPANRHGRLLAALGLTAFLLATPIRVLQAIFAATVTVTAAGQTVTDGAIPPAYELLQGFGWGNPNWLLVLFISITGVGLALFGMAVLVGGPLPGWVGWMFTVSGGLLATYVLVLGDGPPEAVELPLLVGGILTLRTART